MKEAPDMEVRRQALDPRASIVLEAPAGSGKTALLTARFMALLAEVRHPRQILAVTFTRKAAAEMAERISAVLGRARNGVSAGSDNPWEILLFDLAQKVLRAHPDWANILRAPGALLVDTFHGFCGHVARNWPLEAGVPPDFALLDEIGQAMLLEETVQEYLHAFARNDPRLLSAELAAFERAAAAANNSVPALTAQLVDLLARRDRLENMLAIFRRAQPRLELETQVDALARIYLEPLRAYFGGYSEEWRALREFAFAERLPEDVPGAALDALPLWQAAADLFLTKSGAPRRRFLAAEFGVGFSKTTAAQFISALPGEIAENLHFIRNWPMSDDLVGWEALSDMMRLAQGLLERFRSRMAARGLDFTELELAALRAFSRVNRPGESLIFFHEHLRHILVDEAQDMNDTQLRIVGALTEGWEPDDGRTVFIVGDPKQSIFRFRRAEVGLFASLQTGGLPRRAEAALPLRRLSLGANFRSQPHLVQFVNTAFAALMRAPRAAFDEVAFGAAVPARNAAAQATPVEIAVFSCRHPNNVKEKTLPLRGEARLQEAAYVAARAAERQRAEPKARIAVLIPTRTHLTPYVQAMAQFGLPVRLMEGVPMTERPEARHLLNLLRALARPHDDLAWAGALRAPWCRVGAETLSRIAGLADPACWSLRIRTAGRAIHPELLRFNAALDKVLPDFGRESHACALRRLWEELDGPAAVARRYGVGALANCMRCFELLEQCPPGAMEETLEFFARMLEGAYTPPDPRAIFSPVSIMTIHKAKGLEFEHVFVVGLDRIAGRGAQRSAREAAFLMDRLPQAERRYVAATAGARGSAGRPLAYWLLENLGRRRDAAEFRRLIYVAATRARESLTLSGLILRSSAAREEAPQAVDAPIVWFDDLCRRDVFRGLPVEARESPRCAAGMMEEPADTRRDPPPAAQFEPEPLPYLLSSPSRIEDETATAARAGADEENPEARIRGVIMHRIFDALARGASAPATRAVEAALAVEGVAAVRRRILAGELRAACLRAWEFAPFAALRGAALQLLSEWAIEDCGKNGVIRVGRVDLALKMDDGIALIDFKTGFPGRAAALWLQTEIARYRPQLNAYREMVARVAGLAPERVRAALFFTALPHWEELGRE